MQSNTFFVQAQHLSALMNRLTQYTHPTTFDILSICFVTLEMQKLLGIMRQAAVNQKRTLTHFPTTLLLEIARFNRDPSLRTMGRTCKSWQALHATKHQCQWWSYAVYPQECRSPSFRDTPPVLMFDYISHPIPLSPEARVVVSEMRTFTPKEGVMETDDTLFYTRINNEWHFNKSQKIYQGEHVDGILASHLTVDHLRLVVRTASFDQIFVQIPRHSNGSFGQFHQMGVVPYNGSQPFIYVPREYDPTGLSLANVHAWSSHSFFEMQQLIDSGIQIVEYDFMTCQEVKSLCINDLFSQRTWDMKDVYMTWWNNMIIVAIKQFKTDDKSADEDSDSGEDTLEHWFHVEMALINWATGYNIRLPPRKYFFDGDGTSHFLAKLQFLDAPLVFLSLEIHDTVYRKVEVWNPHVIAQRTWPKKRKANLG